MTRITWERSLNVNLIVAWLFAAFSTPVVAIEVVEPGDYPGASSFGVGSVSAGALELGENSISGSLAGHCEINDCNNGVSGDTQDSFRITVPGDLRISNLTVTTVDVSGPSGFSVSASLRSPITTIIEEPFLILDGTTPNLVIRPIVAGEYSISVYGQQASQAGNFSLDWQVEIQVEPDLSLLFSDGFESGDTSHW